jgi:hypothetical protein
MTGFDWTRTPEGTRRYREARARAQHLADSTGFDQGITRNDLFRDFTVHGLPAKPFRSGFELRCEVVHCAAVAKRQPGHGP